MIASDLTGELLSMTWRALLLIALVLVLRPAVVRWLPLKVMPWLWLLVALKLLVPVAPAASWSLYNLAKFVVPAHVTPTSIASDSSVKITATPESHLGAVPAAPLLGGIDWWEILAIGWGAGVILFGTTQVIAHLAFHRRLRREGRPVEACWHDLLGQSARQAGWARVPRLIETDLVAAPAVTGLFSPCLAIPAGLLRQLDAGQTRLLFLHELVHLRRRDLRLLTLFAAIRTLHWFNPLVWWAEAVLRTDCEAACDAEVLQLSTGEPSSYGQVLLFMARLTSGRRNAAISAAAISTNSTQTERRLRLIMRNQTDSRRLSFICPALIMALGFLVLPDEVTAQNKAAAGVDPSFSQSNTSVTAQKLKSIVIDHVNLDRLDVATVLQFLTQKSKEMDPDKKGVVFVLDDLRNPGAGNRIHREVSMTLEAVPLKDVLAYIVQQTNLTYEIEGETVHFHPLRSGGAASPEAPRAALLRKLNNVVIDTFKFDHADLFTVVQALVVRSKAADPEKIGVNFVVNIDPKNTRYRHAITLNIKNASLGFVVAALARQAMLEYSVDDYAVYLRPTANMANRYTVRTYLAPVGFFKGDLVSVSAALGPNPPVRAFDVRNQLTKAGVPFPDDSTAIYLKDSGKIIVRNTPEALDAVAKLIEEASTASVPGP
jgi:beta-lactamase regulating signal transducer with metallopeptidase domain